MSRLRVVSGFDANILSMYERVVTPTNLKMIPSPRLPIELCEFVIDHLSIYDDKATLHACSLTCKAFLHASRYHLFYHVQLTDRQATRFLDIILCSTHSSTSPCAYVRKLTISKWGHGDLRWLNEALPFLAISLLKVTILELYLLQWSQLDDAAKTAILSGFEDVKHLTIAFSLFETPEQMNQFIASFPSMIDLTCSETCWGEDRALVTPRIPLPRSLTTITLDGSQSEFFDQLISLNPHHGVRALNFYNGTNDTKRLGNLLQTLGSSLEHVGLPKQGCEYIFISLAVSLWRSDVPRSCSHPR